MFALRGSGPVFEMLLISSYDPVTSSRAVSTLGLLLAAGEAAVLSVFSCSSFLPCHGLGGRDGPARFPVRPLDTRTISQEGDLHPEPSTLRRQLSFLKRENHESAPCLPRTV